MAFIDYGAILKVDGKLINKGMFMAKTDTDYTLLYAEYENDERHKVSVEDNFFALAGDEDMMLAFYKTYFYVIKNGKIVNFITPIRNSAEVINGISIRFLDDKMNYGKLPRRYRFKYYAKGKCHTVNGIAEVTSRRASTFWRHRNYRYYVEWWHKGKHYEVVYGYGIDSNYEVYNKVKKDYGYTLKEIQFVDNFFDYGK